MDLSAAAMPAGARIRQGPFRIEMPDGLMRNLTNPDKLDHRMAVFAVRNTTQCPQESSGSSENAKTSKMQIDPD